DLVRERNPVNSGLGFLLRQIGREKGSVARVDLLTSLRGTRKYTEDPVRILRDFSSSVDVKNVNIFISDQASAESLMHDRFIIGAEHTIDIGRGLYLLSAAPRHQPTTFAFKLLTDERNRAFHLLRNARRRMDCVAL